MTEYVSIHHQRGSAPLATKQVEREKISEWLKGIIKPVVSQASKPEFNIEFADLAPSHGDRAHAESVDTSSLKKAIDEMGFRSNQIIVEADTIDFNIHYSDASRLVLKQDDFLPLYSIADNDFGICWTWDTNTYSLRGVIWHFSKGARGGMWWILGKVVERGPIYNHALLPMQLTMQLEIHAMHRYVEEKARAIKRCQLDTGYHYYNETLLNEEEIKHVKNPEPLDLEQQSKYISGLAANTATTVLCLERLVQLTDFVSEQATQAIMPQALKAIKPELQQDLRDSSAFIDRQARSAKVHAQGLLEEAKAWQAKSTIVVQTLISLISQQDQNNSLRIARQATRDSTSMKAIAAVTVTFLPGTFIATLFSTTFFSWQQTDPPKTISTNFWIYWIVTLPLTTITISLWLWWTSSTLRKKRLIEDEDNDDEEKQNKLQYRRKVDGLSKP